MNFKLKSDIPHHLHIVNVLKPQEDEQIKVWGS